MVEHPVTSVADGRAYGLLGLSALLILAGILALAGVAPQGWAAEPLAWGAIGAGAAGLMRLVLPSGAMKALAGALVAVAFVVIIDAAPLLFAEKLPRSVKPPVREAFEGPVLLGELMAWQLRAALIGAGLMGLLVVIDRVSILVSRIIMGVLAVILCVMIYEVFVRYVLDAATLWANELSLWFAGGFYLLATLYVLQQRAHIRIFLLYDMLPRWVQRAFDLLSTALILAFSFAIIWGGFKESWRKFLRWETFGTAFDPPIPATMKPLILLTLILIAVQALSNLICDWSKAKQTHDLEAEAREEAAALTEEYSGPPPPGPVDPRLDSANPGARA